MTALTFDPALDSQTSVELLGELTVTQDGFTRLATPEKAKQLKDKEELDGQDALELQREDEERYQPHEASNLRRQSSSKTRRSWTVKTPLSSKGKTRKDISLMRPAKPRNGHPWKTRNSLWWPTVRRRSS